MLQIRLNKGSTTDGGTGSKPLPVETVTVACPDHLILADLPVAKSIGSATAASHIKVVGRRSRRQLGERVHFCVHCDFPIAIYGRLSPCEHAFCLDCARSDSICYLCDERIQKIQTIKMMEGIFICAAPHCLKSFLNKTEFEAHIHENHANLLQPNTRKEEMNESEPFGAKQYSAPDSSLGPPPRSGFLPSSNPQSNEREDRARRQQPMEPPPSRPVMQPKLPPYYGQTSNHLPDLPADNGLATPNHPHQLSFDTQGGVQQDFNQFSDKQQQEILSEPPHHDYPPLYFQPSANFPMPSIQNPVLPNPPPPIGFPPFPSNGAPPFYAGPLPYEVSHSEAAVDQGSFLGFPPFPAVPVNFQQSYPRPGSGAATISAAFDAVQCGQGLIDGDHQGRLPSYQGDYGRNSSSLPPLNPLPLPLSSKAMEQMQAANGMDAKVMLAQKPMPPPPPPPGPPPAHLLQQKLGNYVPGDSSRDGNNYR